LITKMNFLWEGIRGILKPIDELVSADALTRKILFQLADSKTIETALMLFRNNISGRERRTVCVSTQVGCAMGCRFCATGQRGFERDLSTDEIIAQILYFEPGFEAGIIKPKARYVTNVVFMGMGEPLANYENVRQSIAVINDSRGLGLGVHQVTLSTVGLVPQIKSIAAEKLQFELAVSFHAANNELRDRLVPINKKYPLSDLISACKEYTDSTRRGVYFEYALFDGINDSLKDAKALVALLGGTKCSVNLIQGNTILPEFRPTPREQALLFQKRLITSGICTMLRVSRGNDIESGCGQLKSRRPK